MQNVNLHSSVAAQIVMCCLRVLSDIVKTDKELKTMLNL